MTNERTTDETMAKVNEAEHGVRKALTALRLECAPSIVDAVTARFDAYVEAVDADEGAASDELKRERHRLAACLLAAEGQAAAIAEIEHGHPAWSPAFAQVVQLWADKEDKRLSHASACVTLAEMHAAAVGKVTGPRRGVVEDVADLREAALATVDSLRRGDAGEIATAFRILCQRLGVPQIENASRVRVQPVEAVPGDGPYERWSRWLLSGKTGVDLGDLSAAKFSRLATSLSAVAPQGPEVPR